MHFTKIAIAAATIGLAAAQVLFTNSDFSGIEAGEPFEITWTGNVGPVTLTLKNGPADNQEEVAVLAEGLTGESFVWTPAASLESGIYNLQIDDDESTNYSIQFEVTNDGVVLPPPTTSAPSTVTGIAPSITPILNTTASHAQNMTTSPIPPCHVNGTCLPTKTGGPAPTYPVVTGAANRYSAGAAVVGLFSFFYLF